MINLYSENTVQAASADSNLSSVEPAIRVEKVTKRYAGQARGYRQEQEGCPGQIPGRFPERLAGRYQRPQHGRGRSDEMGRPQDDQPRPPVSDG